jgi:hypothetical protein
MRSLIKFPLLALLSLLSAEALLAAPAMAGQAPVTPPDSSGAGVENTFPNGPGGPPSGQMVSERIYNGFLNTLRTIEQRELVPAVGGQDLPISPEQIAKIESSFLDQGNNIETRLTDLEQQIATEMGVELVDLSLLGNSSNDLKTAIDSANTLIRGFDSEELAAAKDSPTFMALLRLLRGGKEALNDPELDRLFEDGGSDFGILQMTRAEVIVPEEAPVIIQPQPAPRPAPQPAPPAVQEPVRGLW